MKAKMQEDVLKLLKSETPPEEAAEHYAHSQATMMQDILQALSSDFQNKLDTVENKLETSQAQFRRNMNSQLSHINLQLSNQQVEIRNLKQGSEIFMSFVAAIRTRELISEFGPNIFDMEEAEKATAEGNEGKKEEEHAV